MTCGDNNNDHAAAIRAFSDARLREEIYRMFNNWCWVSGDPAEKEYYGLLLEESDRRQHTKEMPKDRGEGA